MAGLEPLLHGMLPLAAWFAGLACLFTLLARLTPCNPNTPLLRKGMAVDCAYYFLVPFLTNYVRIFYLSLLFGLFFSGYSDEALMEYFKHGHGALGALPIAVQALLILLIGDVMLYWFHRGFHGRAMWRFHAIHHSSEQVDWHSAYRFHPVNTWLSFTLVDVLMMFAGFSPLAFVALAPFNILYSAFVHANLNWTLGPFKYVLASPVFHRWHHTLSHEGGNRNFAPTFPFLDILFGTFYMPEGKLPERYGVDKRDVPENFADQLLYPFRK